MAAALSQQRPLACSALHAPPASPATLEQITIDARDRVADVVVRIVAVFSHAQRAFLRRQREVLRCARSEVHVPVVVGACSGGGREERSRGRTRREEQSAVCVSTWDARKHAVSKMLGVAS